MPRFGHDFISEVLNTAKTPLGQFMGEEGGGQMHGVIPGGGGFFPTAMQGFGGGSTGGSFGATPIPTGGGGFGGGDHGFGGMMAAWQQHQAAQATKKAAAAAVQAKKDKEARDAAAPPASRDDWRLRPGTTPTSGNDAAAQIVAMAEQRFGPEGAKVVNALLIAEGGLGGAVGDTNISKVGSHGPFQFYGPRGQLDNYARALGVDLPTAGAQARTNPVAAAEWAFDNYLGQAIQRGIGQGQTGEGLLQAALSVQNQGALSSPAHYERYRAALDAPLPTANPLPEIPGQENRPAGIQGVRQGDYARAAGLDSATAAAICGPAAVDAFVRQNGGRTPSLTEAFDLAQRGGYWSQSLGMHGPNATKAVIERMGVPAAIVPARTPMLAREVTEGRLAIVNTRGHYYQAVGYDPETDRFQWGDAVGAGRWARLDQISQWGYGAPDVAIITPGQ